MNPYRIIGIESSPYAVKVRAAMRYQRLPHIWVARMPQFFAETASVRPLIMPVVQFPDGEYHTDSTPIIREVESRHSGERSIVPDNLAAAFLNDLIEDLADEWLTKSLFHYRFSKPADQMSGASWVIDDAHPGLDERALAELVGDFIDRQVSRMPIVGCTPHNAPLFERFYSELLLCLESFVQTDRFLFGSRPALADFALYGQLNTLATDPTAAAIMRRDAPRTVRWVTRLADTSGVEGEWESTPNRAVIEITKLAGRYYLPFLAANMRAIEAGESTVEVRLDGHIYQQSVFRYQAKCYDYLRRTYGNLPDDARERLDPILEETDCLPYLAHT